MTRTQCDELSAPLVRTMLDMEDDILREIAVQLSRDGNVSDTSKWRIRQLARAGRFDKRAASLIAGYSEVQGGQAMDMILTAAETEIGYLDEAVRAANAAGLAEYFSDIPAESSALSAAKAFQKQAASDLNLVNTVMQYGAGSAYVRAVNSVYRESKKARQEVLDVMGKSAAKAVTGQMSLQEVTRKAIRELAQKGIPAFRDKLGREWTPEAYIMMDMRSTLANTARAAQNRRCDEYGITLISVSSHMGARPLCAPYQGRIFSRDGTSGVTSDGGGRQISYTPLSETSFGKPDGLFGINCGHVQYPFAPRINFQRYFPYPEEENAERYKQFQRQRAMERDIRATKRECMMLQQTGDKEGLKKASIRLRTQKEQYSAFCRSNSLGLHLDRTQVYGYDRSVSSKTVWAERKAAIKEKSSTHITPITDKSIEKVPNVTISGYTTAQCNTIRAEHRELLKYSRDNNNGNEVAFVFKRGLTDRKEYMGTDDSLNFGNSLFGADLFVMHNHPRNSSYSDTDITFFLSNDAVKSLSIVKNNGNVEVLTKSENYDKMQLINSFKRCYKKHVKTYSDNEINKAVSAFLLQNKEMIEWIQSP
ncbi:MAG: hypothetical protein J6A37_06865 [Oscillospiraceae bacterium]|nr:hypothetical protein [Oscillospiraceae bacterium]